MKIEIGESFATLTCGTSRECWLVQTNWKSSEHWVKRKTDTELEGMFQQMREEFDSDGSVFKRTAAVGQFMQQGEIDVIGIDQDGNIHALDVAFHEAGLNYGGGVANRVLKKVLRAYILLNCLSSVWNEISNLLRFAKGSPSRSRAVGGYIAKPLHCGRSTRKPAGT